MSDDSEFFKEVIETFLGEAIDHLGEFENLLMKVEEAGSGERQIVSLFRIAHSLKGSAALLGFKKIEGVMHAAESALGGVRDEGLPFDAELTDALMGCCDACRLLVTCIQMDGEEGELDVASVAARLGATAEEQRLLSGPSSAPSASLSSAPLPRAAVAPPAAPPSEAFEAPVQIPKAQSAESSPETSADFSLFQDDKIRVKTKVLDRMMNLVGELVLVRNQILRKIATSAAQTGQLSGMSQRLSHITSELQESVMTTRMQPIETLWLRLPRLVREVSRTANKDVRLITHGADTELDKSIIEHLYDPLIHLIRNAIDHGMETPEERTSTGKPAVGRIEMRAFHEGGLIHIELKDDGRGVDYERVKERAISAGLISRALSLEISSSEVLDLIFQPGFSTREQVGTLSGRGVGLDVVRSNIEKLGGTVSVETVRGAGTTFRLSIPLTLAIIPALLVRAGNQQFAIPQASLLEVVHLTKERVRAEVNDIQGASTFRLREELLPLIRLDDILELENREHTDSLAMVVLESDGRAFGLCVDEIQDTEEIVVKALWPPLRAAGCFAGVTILGDGSVSLILDAKGLGARAHVVRADEKAERAANREEAQTMEGTVESVLLCQSGHGARIALRLSDVHRLEEIPVPSIESTGGGDMVQYRGRILPLVRLSSILEERRKVPREELLERKQDTVDVVVCSLGSREYGLVVDAIVDIVEAELDLQWPGARAGIRGSMVLSGKVTEFLDLAHVAKHVAQGSEGEELSS